jgi:hypothetical protein
MSFKALVFVSIIELFLLIFIATLLFGGDSIPKPIADLHQAIICGKNSEILTETSQSSYHRSSESDFAVYCVNPEGERTDVTWKFIVIFLFGVTFSASAFGAFTAWSAKRSSQPTDADKNARLGELTRSMGTDNVSVNDLRSASPDTISAQLKQLDDAYQKRLIDREEYDKARQRLLDNLGK